MGRRAQPGTAEAARLERRRATRAARQRVFDHRIEHLRPLEEAVARLRDATAPRPGLEGDAARALEDVRRQLARVSAIMQRG